MRPDFLELPLLFPQTQPPTSTLSLAEELAGGGKAPLWRTLAEQIVAERTGSEQRPADGVIVVRTTGKQYDGTASFLQGFYSGLIAAPVPVVGVERADATESTHASTRMLTR